MCDKYNVDVTKNFLEELRKLRLSDPDYSSLLLKEYHKILWSKEFSNKIKVTLNDSRKSDKYLVGKFNEDELVVSSDLMVNSYSDWEHLDYLNNIFKEISFLKIRDFNNISNTIGNFIIFPQHQISKGLYTINQARGTNDKIKDRFDLTLECIRRFYMNIENNSLYSYIEENPLYDVFHRYIDFFKFFKTFKGYCDFFLLQDLVLENYSKINFFLEFDDFKHSPLPQNIEEYNIFIDKSTEFIKKRNDRIKEYVTERKTDINRT